jgi:outer membrane protein OmpA-like peptidoglycan-associated protein
MLPSRCLVLEKRLRDDWDILCHVSKRIINSRVHSAIGVSPADLIFGGRNDLLRGSLFPYTITEQQATPEFLIEMQEKQTDLLRKATRLQNAKKRIQNNDASPKATTFPIHSYVVVKQVEPTNKLAPTWLGSYLVTQRFDRREGDVFRCLHLSTNHKFDFRVDRINPFYFDNDDAVLHQTAQFKLDNEQHEIESVLRHRFNGTNNLQVEIKWIGYDEPQRQPYSQNGLNKVKIVHEYLRRHRLARLIPQKFRRPRPVPQDDNEQAD